MRALVVEDDHAWQQILSELLSDAGLTVDVAPGYDAAILALRAIPHRLAVVDLSLAGPDYRNEDGLRVLEAARRFDPGCTTILLTGFATVELAVSAMKEYGADTCLRKERFRRAEFRQIVQRALALPPLLRQDAPPPETPAATPTPALPPPGTSAVRVLVVEDDAGWRSILHELLSEAGYRVQLCSSYGEALGHLRRKGFALAIIDLALASSLTPSGNVDGYRLLGASKEARIPAIVVSGMATPSDAERVLNEFAVYGFLEKRAFDRRVFKHMVEEALASPDQGSEALQALSEREREVLHLLVEGLTNKEIAERLIISPNTVKRHLKSIFEKLGVNTRAAAVAKAVIG